MKFSYFNFKRDAPKLAFILFTIVCIVAYVNIIVKSHLTPRFLGIWKLRSGTNLFVKNTGDKSGKESLKMLPVTISFLYGSDSGSGKLSLDPDHPLTSLVPTPAQQADNTSAEFEWKRSESSVGANELILTFKQPETNGIALAIDADNSIHTTWKVDRSGTKLTLAQQNLKSEFTIVKKLR